MLELRDGTDDYEDQMSGMRREPARPQGRIRAYGAHLLWRDGLWSRLLWRMTTPGRVDPSSLVPGRPRSAGSRGVCSRCSALILGAGIGAGRSCSELMTRWTLTSGEALAETLGREPCGDQPRATLCCWRSRVESPRRCFFRGALQPSVGLFWASLLFGACHFLPRRELASLWSVFAVLRWASRWGGSLPLDRAATRGADRGPCRRQRHQPAPSHSALESRTLRTRSARRRVPESTGDDRLQYSERGRSHRSRPRRRAEAPRRRP